MPSIFVTGLEVLFLFFFFFFRYTVTLNGARKNFRTETHAVQDQIQFRGKKKTKPKLLLLQQKSNPFYIGLNSIKEEKLKKCILLLFES